MGPVDVTLLLSAVSGGDKKALEKLLPLIYKELRHHAGYLMKGERRTHTLQPTALVHEVFFAAGADGEARVEVSRALLRRRLPSNAEYSGGLRAHA